jgi:uncharacterized protein YdeI (YjbR/CyaY-like superfamily)
MAMRKALDEHATFDAKTRTALLLTAAAADKSPYTVAINTMLARQAGSMASDLAEALNTEPEARRFFESLVTFYRKGFVRWIDGAKRPETRAKRIAETVAALKAGKRQR